MSELEQPVLFEPSGTKVSDQCLGLVRRMASGLEATQGREGGQGGEASVQLCAEVADL